MIRRLLLAAITVVLLVPARAHAIPVFARQYRTTCTTCHVVPPKLNSLGEAFRINGYRFPRTTRLVRQEAPVPLGDEAWKDEWPRAIWPGEVAGTPGISLRLQSDVEARRGAPAGYAWTYRFPADVYVLGASSLGDGLAAFLESEWTPDAGFRVLQAKVSWQDPVRALPRHLVGVWFGLQGTYPLMFTDRQVDRAGRQTFTWQTFAMSDVRLDQRGGAQLLSSRSDTRAIASVPAVEVEGVIQGRFGYGLGLAQGGSSSGTDRNTHKDPYVRVRYKLGGMRLDGEQPKGTAEVRASRGQLRDRTLVLEAFAYRGSEPSGSGANDDTYGRQVASARLVAGPVDLGIGVSRTVHDDPWGLGAGARLRSVFGKAELTTLPWMLVSLKGERVRFDMDQPTGGVGVVGDPGRTVVFPGVVMMARPNVRFVLEGELYTRRPANLGDGVRRPHALWIRTDLSF